VEQVIVLARAPLHARTTYNVTVEGTCGGSAFAAAWSFTTARQE
jgi:hypothetical protein